jgi:hypothetical protein
MPSLTIYDDTGRNEDFTVDNIVYTDDSILVGILNDGSYVMINKSNGEVASFNHRFYYASFPE